MFVVLVFYFILHDHYHEIVFSLKQLTFLDFCFLVVCGLIFFMLDAFAHCQLIRPFVHKRRWIISLELVSLNNFFNATTSSMGTIPFQSYYLKKNNIPYSKGVSSMFLNMIFHKIAVCINAFVMFLFSYSWLMKNPNMNFYIGLGFGLNILIIIGLIVFIFWHKTEWIFIQLSKLFKKEETRQELQQLADNAQDQLTNIHQDLVALLAHGIKVMWLCAIPYFCLAVLHETSLGFAKIYTLSSLAYIIASSLPNVAGIGPLEYAYLVLFSYYISGSASSASLLLYRIFSFYLLFVISTFVFMHLKKILWTDKKREGDFLESVDENVNF